MNLRPRPLPADERRAATVEAVVELAAEQNPGDITTAAIAQRMGLTQGALFRHFPSKDAILEAVLGWVSERLLAQLDAAAASAASPLAALEAMFMAHVGFVASHPDAVERLFFERGQARAGLARRSALERGLALRVALEMGGLSRCQLVEPEDAV